MLNKRILVLVSLLLVSFLLIGCWPTPIVENHAPIITSDPVETVTVGVKYTYDVEANDQDGDALTYSLITKPSLMSIDEDTGLITWIPDTVGSFDVTVMVSDGLESPTQSFTIIVTSVVELDHIVVDPDEITLFVGEPQPFTVTAHYNNGTKKEIGWADYSFDENPMGIVYVYPTLGFGWMVALAEGTTTITLTYEDKSDTIAVTVGKPMEITADMPTFEVGIPEWFTVNMTANGDLGRSVEAHFGWPTSVGKKIEGTLETDGKSDVTFTLKEDVFQTEVFIMEDATANFRGTFTSAGTYSTTIEVKTTNGTPLCSKKITIVVE